MPWILALDHTTSLCARILCSSLVCLLDCVSWIENGSVETVWNSTVEFFCRNIFGFAKTVFFVTKIPYVAIFYCLGCLVDWLRFGMTLRDVCQYDFLKVALALVGYEPWMCSKLCFTKTEWVQ